MTLEKQREEINRIRALSLSLKYKIETCAAPGNFFFFVHGKKNLVDSVDGIEYLVNIL